MKRLILTAALLAAGCTKAKQEPQPKATVEYFRVDPAQAGTVTGSIHYKGKPQRGKLIAMDAEEDCQKLHKKPVYEDLIVTGKTGGLANAFVYIKTGLEGKKFEPQKYILNRFDQYLQGHLVTSLEAVTPTLLKDWMDTLTCSPTTRIRYAHMVRRFFDHRLQYRLKIESRSANNF